MSVDISDPSISSARENIFSPGDSRSWLCLGYTEPPNALRLIGLGSDPALPSIRQIIHNSDEQVLFAYAKVKRKGLVVAYIRDSIGGVKRARAVVHSRAVAGLFPEYSALLTIAHHSQLSDEEVAEKLGVSLPLYTSVRRASKPLPSPLSSPPLPRTPKTPTSMHTPQLSSNSPAIDTFSVVALREGEGRYPVPPSHGRPRSASMNSDTSVSLIPMGAVTRALPGVGSPIPTNGEHFASSATPRMDLSPALSNGNGTGEHRSPSIRSHASFRSRLSRKSSKKDQEHGTVTPTKANSKGVEAMVVSTDGGHLPNLQETLQATPSPIKDTTSPAGHADNSLTTPVKSTVASNGIVEGQQALGRGPAPLAPGLPANLSRLMAETGRAVSSPVYRHSVAQRIVSAPVVPNERRPLPVPRTQSPQRNQQQQLLQQFHNGDNQHQDQEGAPQPQYPNTYTQKPFELSKPPKSRASPQTSPSKPDARVYSGQYPGEGAPSSPIRESYYAQQLRQFQESELQRTQSLAPPSLSDEKSSADQAEKFERLVQAKPPNPPRLVGTPSSDGRAEELETIDELPSKAPSPRAVVFDPEEPSPKGISSEDYGPKRLRKLSFTSRLGALVTRSPKSPQSPRSVSGSKIPDTAAFGIASSPKFKLAKDKGPTSPNGVSRFIKNFGRRSSGAAPSPPTSPIVTMDNGLPSSSPSLPPPTPPLKGDYGLSHQQSQTLRSVSSPLASANGNANPLKSPRRVPVPVPEPGNPSASPSSSFSATVGGHAPRVVAVPPSSSAQKALAQASERSVRDESANQERFRRDTEEQDRLRQEGDHATSRQSQASRVSNRSRQSGAPASPVRPKRPDDDQYFDQRTRRSSRRSLKSQVQNETPLSEAAGYARSVKGRGSGVYDSVYDQEYSLEYTKQSPVQTTFDPSVRPTAAVQSSCLLQSISNADSVEAVQSPSSLTGSHKGLPFPSPGEAGETGVAGVAAAGLAAAGAGVAAVYHAAKSSVGVGAGDDVHEVSPHQGLQSETRENEGVATRMAELDLAEDGQAGGTAVEMSVQAEQHARALHDGSEDNGGPSIPDGFVVDDSAHNDADPLLAEPSHVAEDGESMIIARAIQEEEERAERERLEEEQQRIAERARIVEQQRLAELAELERLETERREQEALRAQEKRIAEEKAAEERRLAEIRAADIAKRREAAYARLHLARQEGGLMLSGWVTVQTIQSMMWRRRWFNLFANELRLFKSQGDSKPITVIPLGSSASVSSDYEETQVQGSFKLLAPSGEEYFLYTDTADDNALILKGLSLVTGRWSSVK